MELFGRI